MRIRAALAITVGLLGCNAHPASVPGVAGSGSAASAGSTSACAAELAALDAWWNQSRTYVKSPVRAARLPTHDGPILTAADGKVLVDLMNDTSFTIDEELTPYDHVSSQVADAVGAKHATTAMVAINGDTPWRRVLTGLQALEEAGIERIELLFAPPNDPVQAVRERYPRRPEDDGMEFLRKVRSTLADCPGAWDALDTLDPHRSASLAPVTDLVVRCGCKPEHLEAVNVALTVYVEHPHSFVTRGITQAYATGTWLDIDDGATWESVYDKVVALPDGASIALVAPPPPLTRDQLILEGRVVLHGLMLDLAAAADTNHAFPVGTAPLTPATPCCAAADQECSHDPAPWEVDPWKTIGFRYAPAHLQYDYTSDGKTFTAHAVFDEKCDGAIGKVTLEGRIKGKKFQYKVEDPE